MAGYNRIVMIGNLTRDPEYRQLASGQGVCRLGLASNRQFKNRQTGDMIQEVCFVDIDVWGAQAESCNQYLAKGRQVLIEGRLKFDTWEGQEGQTRSKHSIVADRVVFLTSGSDQNESSDMTSTAKKQPNSHLDPAVEKELADQIEQIKKRSNSAAKEAKSSSKQQAKESKTETGDGEGAAFQDEPPFQDDLPF